MKIKNQRGMSLVEILVSIGILGFVYLATSRLIQNQSTQNKTSEIKSEADNVLSEIRNILSDQKSCTATLGGIDLGGSPPPGSVIPNIKKIYNALQPPLNKFAVGVIKHNLGLVEIEKYSWEKTSVIDSTLGLSPLHDHGIINLRVYFKFDNRKKGASQIVKDIRIHVVTESIVDRRIKQCVASSTFSSADTRYLNRLTGGVMTGNIIMADGTKIIFASDAKFKEDTRAVSRIIQELRKTKPVKYHWEDTNNPSYGLIAQDILLIFPELVKWNSEMNKYVVDYLQLFPLLIAGIKELDEENKKMRLELSEMEMVNIELKQKICSKNAEQTFCRGSNEF